MAVIILFLATIVGVAGLLYIPNWQDFEYNGHPSLVTVAGTIGLGLLAFVLGFGLTAWTLFRIAAIRTGRTDTVLDNPNRPQCGQPLDIVIEDGR
jgi:hypothetical protein